MNGMPLYLEDPQCCDWILRYLKRSPGRIIREGKSKIVIPPKCEAVDVILREGQSNGFGVARMRRARMQIDSKVVVVHAPNSKRWMWRLLRV